MTVFEKIENALKKIDSRCLTTRIAPLAIAAVVSATAVACYAAQMAPNDPGRVPAPQDNSGEVVQPDTQPQAGAPVAPTSVPAAKSPSSKSPAEK